MICPQAISPCLQQNLQFNYICSVLCQKRNDKIKIWCVTFFNHHFCIIRMSSFILKWFQTMGVSSDQSMGVLRPLSANPMDALTVTLTAWTLPNLLPKYLFSGWFLFLLFLLLLFWWWLVSTVVHRGVVVLTAVQGGCFAFVDAASAAPTKKVFCQ